jgi:hypothetical protein
MDVPPPCLPWLYRFILAGMIELPLVPLESIVKCSMPTETILV